MSEGTQSTKFLFNHKVDKHLEDLVASNYKVTTLQNDLPIERVFDQSWKKALETNCEVEKQFFSELEPHARSEYLKWIKSKRYSNLGSDRIHVDEVIIRGIKRSFEVQKSIQLQEQRAILLAEEQSKREILLAEEKSRIERELLAQKVTEFWEKCGSELHGAYSNFESFESEAEQLGISVDEFRGFRNLYVNDFLINNCLGNSKDIQMTLDGEQLWAIGEPCDSTALISARAGSGKTTVLSFRALFLIKRFEVDPMGMVMLAFNRAAALELKARIAKLLLAAKQIPHSITEQTKQESDQQFNQRVADQLEALLTQKGQRLPLITTFHALGRGIVYGAANNDAQYLAQIVTDEDDERTLLSDCVNEAISRILNNGSELKFRQMMLEHFETDWMEILRVQSVGKNPILASEYESYPRDTLRGDSVRSHGEKSIADFLYKRNIDYKYEKPIARENTVTFPDFTITRGNKPPLIIEFFGIVGVNSYHREAVRKIRNYEVAKVPILSLYPKDISSGEYVIKIINFLVSNEYSPEEIAELSSEALWEKMRIRGRNEFNSSVYSFIARASQRNLSPETINQRLPLTLGGEELSGNVLQFSILSTEVYGEYLSVLREKRMTDFNQILQNATLLLRQGVCNIFSNEKQRDLSRTTHVFVDEFQDFSPLFQDLVDEILNIGSNKTTLTAVGDSWQSINSFMGSDESIIESFSTDYPSSKRLNLLRNYRSKSDIVFMGNNVMSKVEGEPSIPVNNQPAMIALFKNEECVISQEERDVLGSESLAHLLRLLGTALAHCNEVAVLFRFKKLRFGIEEDFSSQVTSIKRKLARVLGSDKISRIEFSTVHKYKGKEADAVILWDSNDSVYPFVHNNWSFNAFFGVDQDSLVSEERRLFYVGVTRAKSMLLINTDENPTPFLQGTQIKRRPWPESLVDATTLIERALFQIFLTWNPRDDALREVLKKKFRFIPSITSYWESEINTDDFELIKVDPKRWVEFVWKSYIPNFDPPPGSIIKVIYGGQTQEREFPKTPQ